MLDDSLTFPQTADDWLQTVVIGGVLSLLGFLILPAFVVQGYLLRVVRAAATGEAAPSFTDWGELLVDGLRLFVLQLAVVLLVGIPFVVVFGVGGAFGVMTGSRAFTGVVVLLGFLVVGLLALVVGYFLPAAIANFAVEDSLRAAFDLGTVAEGALTSDYAMAWLLALVIGLVGGLVGGALSVILVGVFIVFYVQVVTYYLFGRGFAAGLGIGPWGVGTEDWSGGRSDRAFGGGANDETTDETADDETADEGATDDEPDEDTAETESTDDETTDDETTDDETTDDEATDEETADEPDDER